MSPLSPNPPSRPRPELSFSIVSHGQGAMIRDLLSDLAALRDVSFEVVLTINLPEDESFFAGFDGIPLKVIRNPSVRGFGANHNGAFEAAEGKVFVVTNPDIRARAFDPAPLLETLGRPQVGACGPSVVSGTGVPEDSPRRFPSIPRLARRVFTGKRDPDYAIGAGPIEVDWVGGMFVAFRSEVFRQIGGFDERFFMYLEDVDICRRLDSAGWHVVFDPRCRVVHEAQRKSHSDKQHIDWHVRSMARYLLLYRLTRRWSRHWGIASPR